MRRLPLPLFAFIVLTLLFFWRIAFTDLILARGDTFAYFYPYWHARDGALAAGDLPLWTPDLFMGAPLLANLQLGTLYPPNWLTISLNTPDSVTVSIILHVLWAGIGTYLLARRALKVRTLPAIVAGVLFAFGGEIGSHVEQINQLQGMAWLPWMIWLLLAALQEPRRYLPWLGVAWGMQLLSGHTQTVFMTGIALGVVGLTQQAMTSSQWRPLLRPIGIILLGALVAVIVAAPQLIPAAELTGLSNRSGGLTQQEATAFSLEPALIGRGLLPSYGGQPFGEYVSYLGVIGLGLAVLGALGGGRRRWPWIVLGATGLIFALGRFTPVYLLLAQVPGFDLFRVPARWLVLFSLAGSMLAALGMQAYMPPSTRLLGRVRLSPSPFHRMLHKQPLKRTLPIALGVIGLLAASTLLADRAADQVNGSAVPTAITWAGWGLAAAGLVLLLTIGKHRRPLLLTLLVIAELFLTSLSLPYNDATDPDIWHEPRFTTQQMAAYGADEVVPGRLLSITAGLGDPGDRATLEARWAAMGLNDNATAYAFTAVKLQEAIAANLPLRWTIPSVDGFGGGVLPTQHYSDFTALMLPPGTDRSVDGRLRELLALPECRGACVPDDRWLDLTNTQYLLLDRVFDRVHEGIFYDTGLQFAVDSVIANPTNFVADSVHLLIACGEDDCPPPDLRFDDTPLTLIDDSISVDGLRLLQYQAERVTRPREIGITGTNEWPIQAVTLVDTRTGDFTQLAPAGWQRVFSGDVKIYENLDVLPRAFIVGDAQVFPDDADGTEAALQAMTDAIFDPRTQITINRNGLGLDGFNGVNAGEARVVNYSPTRVEITVSVDGDGWLVLNDAFYPGWSAQTSDGAERTIYRANVMFRAVPVNETTERVIFTYAPPFNIPVWAGVIWLVTLIIAIGNGIITRP